jgi:hypothetical protein
MPVDPELRKRLIADALRSVEVAAKARGWYDQFDDGHRHKTPEQDWVTTELLEGSIRTAMGYGYPVEAVAVAADLSIDEVQAIAGGAAA